MADSDSPESAVPSERLAPARSTTGPRLCAISTTGVSPSTTTWPSAPSALSLSDVTTGFSRAAAAGVPPPAPVIMPEPYLVPAAVYGAPPTPSYTARMYTAPVRVVRAAEPLPQPPPSQTRTAGPAASLADMLRLGEVRLGIAGHDTGVFGHNKEDGVDIVLGVRFQPLGGEVWDMVANPRPFLGFNINTAGDTSSLNGGLNWDWDMWNQSFFSFAWGGALHNGKLGTADLNRKELGSRVLFYLAAELGYRFDRHQSVAVRLDHMSNAGLTDNNEGLDTIGLVYGYHF